LLVWHAWRIRKINTGKPKGKTQLERPGCRWEDNVKINIRGKI
jgi:hypothetical protein